MAYSCSRELPKTKACSPGRSLGQLSQGAATPEGGGEEPERSAAGQVMQAQLQETASASWEPGQVGPAEGSG